MRPRFSHVFMFLDYAVGAFFVLAMMAFAVAVFVITGPPKQYEAQALGAAYTVMLEQVEAGARKLRVSYCEQADADAAAQANCERPSKPQT